MRLLDALKILQKADTALPVFKVFLACGFTPLHLQTFLAASIQQRLTDKYVELSVGMYGDLPGNIVKMTETNLSAGVVVLEWQDLDPRLGIRRVSGWDSNSLAEITADVRQMLLRLERLLLVAAERMRVVVCFPTLPFPLLSSQHPNTVSPIQADLELALHEMTVRLLAVRTISVFKQAASSNLAFNPEGELLLGFPYSLSHASDLGTGISEILCLAPNKKGVITDLDMTLWNGILGDDGVEGVYWDLDHKAQPYGLYQQLLHALAKEGVLVAVASRNSPEIVQQIFAQRQDLVLKESDVFPLVAAWQPKSEAVEKILQTWNIGPESVVFIDDNPFELEEVKRRHPQIECIQFNPSPRSVMDLWHSLRTRFARQTISEEDRIRSASIRTIAENKMLPDHQADIEDFLESLHAEMRVDLSRNSDDERAFELINKTNQFNLNGTRLTDEDFRTYLIQEGAFLLTLNYSDKFGGLGKVSSLLARMEGHDILIDSWVLSCRAFSHRIEFVCLYVLFEFCDARHVCLRWQPTGRNNHLNQFLTQLPGTTVGDRLIIERSAFMRDCPALPYKITPCFAEGLEIHV